MDLNELQGLLDKGYSGSRLSALYTEKTDVLLTDIFSSMGDDMGLCLIAVGGYGRAELSPYSDIDIMLFARDRSVSDKAAKFLYRLWDAHLDVGHSFRTPADCIREAKSDIKTRTSLLEHRYIAGDKGLYRYFMDNVHPEIAYRGAKGFIAEKMREAEMRHRGTGNSVFMLEPHIKEGRGGLRDIHTIVWLAGVKLRLRHFDELAGILAPDSFRKLKKAYDFLLKVRFCLHLINGRRNDILSFEFHDRIAEILHFRASEGFFAAERFMRYLYLKMAIIKDTTSGLLDMFSVPYGVGRAEQDMDSFPSRFFRKKVTEDFCISGQRIMSKAGVLNKNPVRIIEAFYIMATTGKNFSPGLRAELRKNLVGINSALGTSHAVVEFFMGILRADRVYETLREMHDSGVLGRFIPEFGALRFLVVYEPYHRYTVDEHSLRAIEKLAALRNTKYKKLEHLSSVFTRINHKEALFLSLLLHDIGKRNIGRDSRYGAGAGHHEEVGYRELKNISERFNIDIVMRSRIEFLVKHHILMAACAFKCEIDSPEVISQFADEVGDRENLDALYLLTYADMAAVSPDFLSDWKACLLRELYEAASLYFERVRKRLGPPALSPDPSDKGEKTDSDDFLSAMPERYILGTLPERIAADYGLYAEAQDKGFAMTINEGGGGTAEITIGTWDVPGLFSRIVSALSAMGMNIFRARLYTGTSGIVIDRIQVSNWKDLWWDGMPQQVEENLSKAIGSRGITAEILNVKERRTCRSGKASVRFEPFIEVDNETSADSTILEFFAVDRLGLLTDVTALIYEKGVDIISARINTESGLVNDIFHIQKEKSKLAGEFLYTLLLSLWKKLN